MNDESYALINIIADSDFTPDDVHNVQQLQSQLDRIWELMPLCKSIVSQAIFEMSLLDKEVNNE